jgi:hypothetical protein
MKCSLFTVGSAYRVTRFTVGGKRFTDDGGAEVAETTVKIFLS